MGNDSILFSEKEKLGFFYMYWILADNRRFTLFIIHSS